MATKIEKLEKMTGSRQSHLEALLEGLDNEPQNYIWTGIVNDLGIPCGSCVCGHEIRYEFVLEHKTTKKRKIVGSVCIETFQILDEATTMAIVSKRKEIEAELRRAKAEAKKLVQKEEIQKLIEERQPLVDTIRSINKLYLNAGEWRPYDIYSYSPVDEKKYVQLGACIKALKKDITRAKEIIIAHEEDVAKLTPVVEEKVAKEEAEVERKKATQWVGTVGERIELTVTLIDSWFNANWNSTIHKFHDANGNVFVKWGVLANIDFEIGKTYKFSAEVKKHTEYQGEKSTTITYIKNVEVVA